MLHLRALSIVDIKHSPGGVIVTWRKEQINLDGTQDPFFVLSTHFLSFGFCSRGS